MLYFIDWTGYSVIDCLIEALNRIAVCIYYYLNFSGLLYQITSNRNTRDYVSALKAKKKKDYKAGCTE
jgi:hypothetical protein